jgi:alkylresorcinol/alkylpyrone synthase
MVSILSVERYVPPYRYEQPLVTDRVRRWLEQEDSSAARRLLSVYDSAGVTTRGSVVPIDEVFEPADFETQNRRYRELACDAGTDVARRAIAAAGLDPGEIEFFVSVSCTGFMIPALDAYVANTLGMGPRLARLPITEAGCAGGVVGLARAYDHLTAHPSRAAVVLAVELSSLTFQPWDRSPSNVVSTAIFGDGGAAVVLVGDRHPAAGRGQLRIRGTGSAFFPGTTRLMGFELRNAGLQIVLDKGLAPFVRREVAPVIDGFLAEHCLDRGRVARWILHPGGRRVIEVMAERLELRPEHVAATRAVLAEHGNMSSVTVLFVLDEILRRQRPAAGSAGLLAAFGPGFSAEIALVEFL